MAPSGGSSGPLTREACVAPADFPDLGVMPSYPHLLIGSPGPLASNAARDVLRDAKGAWRKYEAPAPSMGSRGSVV